jgi:hypothetical protein
MYKYTILLVYITLLINTACAKNAERRSVVRDLMERQGYTFYGFSYHHGGNITADVDYTNDTNSTEKVTKRHLEKRSCASFFNGCGSFFALEGKNAIVLKTNACLKSATNDDVLFCLDGKCLWLDKFLCNDFERWQQNAFPLPKTSNVQSNYVYIIEKFGDQLWQFEPVEIYIALAPGNLNFDSPIFPFQKIATVHLAVD